MTETISQQYNQYKKIIATFPVKCKMYISLLIGVHDESCTHQIPKTIRKNYEAFTATFKRLSSEQRLYFVGQNIEFVVAHLKECKVQKPPLICEIETTCQLKSSFIGVPYWEKRIFKYEVENGLVRLVSAKKTEGVQLKNYLMRKSLSDEYAVVFEAIEASVPENKQKISIKFANLPIFEEMYSKIRQSITSISNKRMEVLLGEERVEKEETIIKGLTFLTKKMINEYFQEKVELMLKVRTKMSKSFVIYNRGDLRIRNSSEGSKYYSLEFGLPWPVNSLEMVKNYINILGFRNIPNRYYCQKLQSLTNNISAKYYKLTAEDQECQSIMIVQTLQKEENFFQIMKATEGIFLGINIPFISIEIRKEESKRFIFYLQAIIKSNTKHRKRSKEAIKLLLSMVSSNQYLQNVSNIHHFTPTRQSLTSIPIRQAPGRKKSHSNPKQEKNAKEQPLPENIKQLSISRPQINSFASDDAADEVFYSIENVQNDEIEGERVQQALNLCTSKSISTPKCDIEEEISRKEKRERQICFLSAPPFLLPRPQPRRYIEELSLLKDWKKLQKGGVVCVKEAAIAEQKKIFKLICKQFGNKLFKMQGFTGLSLPIQICRPESTLISIARNITYAPLLFENHHTLTPLQRMNNLIIFQVSMAALALSAESPLNPILGETFQGSINGCPLYMQQLSHHPPVSYLLFMGRGFRVFGAVAPQVCIRLNYVKGVNARWMAVEFEGGGCAEFSIPTMIINGMLFGDRNVYFEGINYVLDEQLLLLAEVVFNAGNKGLFGPKESPDFLTAHVYQVTPAFIAQFREAGGSLSPKREGNKLLEVVTGEWNGRLWVNEEVLFNFEKSLPLLLEHYTFPLHSDSVYRSDAVELSGGTVERAQAEKERLEELQRRDKRLRESGGRLKK